jgi:OmcA/MtrC family decaheme c-type cytochrome
MKLARLISEKGGASVTHSWRRGGACLAAVLILAAAWTVQSRATALAATAFQYNIIEITSGSTGHTTVGPGEFAVVRFSVTNPQTGEAYDLMSDPEWRTAGGVSRLFLQIAWNTREFTNTDSGSNAAGGRGAAIPIPINALPLGANAAKVTDNLDGTYSVTAPLPVPFTASGTGEVVMEGHPAGQDAAGAWTVRVPVTSAYRYFPITDASARPRRQIVSAAKCMACHRSDGTGAAPQLTVHGSNRTEEPQVCIVCHNPNNTDIPFRLAADPKALVGRYAYPEQSIDFKTLVHGIHASTTGFREEPLVVIGFNHTVFDASTLVKYPGELRNCVTCHIDNRSRGTFELPLSPDVLGSTFDTKSISASGVVTIDTDPTNDVKVSPTAAVCSSCHDEGEEIDHMVRTGGASFSTTQADLDNRVVVERCVRCHGPGKKMSVRRVHQVR